MYEQTEEIATNYRDNMDHLMDTTQETIEMYNKAINDFSNMQKLMAQNSAAEIQSFRKTWSMS